MNIINLSKHKSLIIFFTIALSLFGLMFLIINWNMQVVKATKLYAVEIKTLNSEVQNYRNGLSINAGINKDIFTVIDYYSNYIREFDLPNKLNEINKTEKYKKVKVKESISNMGIDKLQLEIYEIKTFIESMSPIIFKNRSIESNIDNIYFNKTMELQKKRDEFITLIKENKEIEDKLLKISIPYYLQDAYSKFFNAIGTRADFLNSYYETTNALVKATESYSKLNEYISKVEEIYRTSNVHKADYEKRNEGAIIEIFNSYYNSYIKSKAQYVNWSKTSIEKRTKYRKLLHLNPDVVEDLTNYLPKNDNINDKIPIT